MEKQVAGHYRLWDNKNSPCLAKETREMVDLDAKQRMSTSERIGATQACRKRAANSHILVVIDGLLVQP